MKVWKTSQVLWDLNADGTALVSPVPGIMSLLGSASAGRPVGTDEKRKVRVALGRNAAQEDLG